MIFTLLGTIFGLLINRCESQIPLTMRNGLLSRAHLYCSAEKCTTIGYLKQSFCIVVVSLAKCLSFIDYSTRVYSTNDHHMFMLKATGVPSRLVEWDIHQIYCLKYIRHM